VTPGPKTRGKTPGDQVAARRRLPIQHFTGHENTGQARSIRVSSTASRVTPPAVEIASSMGAGTLVANGKRLDQPGETFALRQRAAEFLQQRALHRIEAQRLPRCFITVRFFGRCARRAAMSSTLRSGARSMANARTVAHRRRNGVNTAALRSRGPRSRPRPGRSDPPRSAARFSAVWPRCGAMCGVQSTRTPCSRAGTGPDRRPVRPNAAPIPRPIPAAASLPRPAPER
jgi:hypothetical protein